MSILTKTKEKPSTLRELGKIVDIPIEMVRPNPNQPRRHFDSQELASLAKSISQDGIIQPLTIRRVDRYFELISGERRLRAAKIAGLRSVPCIIVDISNQRSAVLALIENIQRSDLNFFEEAQAISLLIKEFGLTQEETAMRLGMAQSTVANKLRLLKLTAQERQIIFKNKLTERHARALLKIEDEGKRNAVLAHVIENGLTVDETEKYIQSLEKQDQVRESYQKRSPILKDIKLFFNTVDKAVKVMRLAGVDAEVKKSRHDGIIEYTVLVPEKKEAE
ncbi:MAG: ParB/RepB/Spo0J family partition protein [Oscillospiraceae bacterium]